MDYNTKVALVNSDAAKSLTKTLNETLNSDPKNLKISLKLPFLF